MVRWQNTNRLAVIAVVFCILLPGWVTPLAAQEQKGSTEAKRYTFTQAHLGTIVRLVVYSAERSEVKRLAERCFERVVELDGVFSDYRDDSELMKLCKVAHKQATPVSDELFAVLLSAEKISEQTSGAFDVTMGASTKEWRRLKQGGSSEVVRSLVSSGYQALVLDEVQKTVSFKKPLSLDLGGIAKGYIADELADLLQAGGVKDLAVAVGGEMVLAGSPPELKGWSVNLEGPGQKVIASVELSEVALSTSGDSYQFAEVDGKRSAHVLDPHTGEGKQDRLNITVIAPTAMQADAWATALRVLGVEKGHALADKEDSIEVMFAPAQGEVITTGGFPVLRR